MKFSFQKSHIAVVHPNVLFLAFVLIFTPIEAQAWGNYLHCLLEFGTVKVISNPANSEEFKKVKIIGKLAEHYTKHVGYKEPILLDLIFEKPDFNPPMYVGSNDELYPYVKSLVYNELTCNSYSNRIIEIHKFTMSIDAETTLKLLECAIRNTYNIKTQQLQSPYPLESQNFKSISTETLEKYVAAPASKQVKNILSQTIERPETDNSYGLYEGLSYYFKNNSFTVFTRRRSENDSTEDFDLLTIPNIFQWCKVSRDKALVFDTDSTFYFVEEDYSWNSKGVRQRGRVSKKHIIKGRSGSDDFLVQHIGGGRYTIYFEYSASEKEVNEKMSIVKSSSNPRLEILKIFMPTRTLLYKSFEDELIPDLDELINNRK